MHRMGAVCSLKYQQLMPSKYRSKVSMRYTSHSMALKRVRELAPKTLVDIGCGPGHVARECTEMGIEVTGIDVAEPLPGMMAHFRQFNLEDMSLPVDVFSYDAALLLDVIEHLENPENFLLELRNRSRHISPTKKAPRLILTTPNVAFIFVRLNLLLGRFNYAERGILDIGHKRLFTRSTLVRMLRDCGYEIERVEPVPAPFEVVMPGSLGKLLGQIAWLAAQVWGKMFAFQWLIVCRPKPGIHHLLSITERPVAARYPLPEAPAELSASGAH
jgi:2-polyprenyl-3-methyl-5-hydroxy-6-metoxy-1,4-benzoquinol methylase